MGRKLKAISYMLLFSLALSVFPYTASAKQLYSCDDAGYGTNLAYVNSSGKVSVDGNTYQAYSSFEEALNALGEEGGTILFSGTVEGFTDVPGRGSVQVLGLDESAVFYYPDDLWAINLNNTTYFDNFTISVNSNEAVIYPNGNKLTMGSGIKSVMRDDRKTDRCLYIYGNNNSETNKGSEVIINGGVYSRIAGANGWCTNGGIEINGDINYTLNGGEFKSIFGAAANASEVKAPVNINGNINFTLNGGVYSGNIYTGSLKSGSVNGNVTFEINGGEFKNGISILNGALVKGSAIKNSTVIINDGNLQGVVLGKSGANEDVTGEEIYIINNPNCGAMFSENSQADYMISVKGGKVNPVFSGENLLGFKVTSAVKGAEKIIYVNGEKASVGNGGLININKGRTDIEIGVKPSNYKLDKNASFIKGYVDGSFKPQSNMTRAEAVTTLLRLIANENDIKGLFTSSFTDVTDNDWFSSSIAFFEALGYLSSYKDTFLPNQNITRAEFVELIYYIAEFESASVYEFSDVPVTNPRYYFISAAASNKLVTGYPDGTFQPDGLITRAEVVTIINRLLKRAPTGTEGLNKFNDIEGYWAMDNIIAAANESVQTINGKEVKIWGDAISEEGADFQLPESAKTAGEYIKVLKDESLNLSPSQFIKGLDKIAEMRKIEIINTPNMAIPSGTVYYISNSGNDSNSGTSPDQAFATMTKMTFSPIQAGDTVLFERGGEWRGQLPTKEGVTYSAYGEGAKPIINGSLRNFADASIWEETDYPNVYKLKTAFSSDSGIMAFDHTGVIGNNNELVGIKKIIGIGDFTGLSDLTEDLWYMSDKSFNVYLCSTKGNPGERFKSIEIGTRTTVIPIGGSNITIDNLCIKYGGSHGVGAGTQKNLTVSNCIFCWIGGSIWSGTTRFGNAIQVYGGCDGYNVKNNYIYQIYDTGVTHQYTGWDGGDIHMQNVNYSDNVIEYCHWSIEYYNQPKEGTNRSMKNIHIWDNICRYQGYGWGKQRPDIGGAHLNSFSVVDNVENFVVENNVFDRAKNSIIRLTEGGDRKVILRNNVYIQEKDKTLGMIYTGTFTFNQNTAKYLSVTGEENPTIIFAKYEE